MRFWNFLVASTVEASHFPFGFPANEPSFASACWISEMRSGLGAFCPAPAALIFSKFFFRATPTPPWKNWSSSAWRLEHVPR